MIGDRVSESLFKILQANKNSIRERSEAASWLKNRRVSHIRSILANSTFQNCLTGACVSFESERGCFEGLLSE